MRYRKLTGQEISKSFGVVSLIVCFSITTFSKTSFIEEAFSQKMKIVMLTQNTPANIRSLSVVNDSVIWAGGSNGYVGKSLDGGKTWTWMQPETVRLDFRSLYAFDRNHAVIANAGAPAVIFLTKDGGLHWTKVFSSPDTSYFFDGMTFRNKKDGIIYGDPIDGKWLILRSKDGGLHWESDFGENSPKAKKDEASFAASNSAIFNLPGTKLLWLSSGGSAARVFFSKDFGKHWKVWNTDMLQGKNSAGIFSIAFVNKRQGICVGGDYMHDDVRFQNALLTRNGGETWKKPVINPWGYRSCVIYISSDTLLATGTTGTDISTDGGMIWKSISKEGFNVAQKARSGRSVFLAGENGKIAKIIFQQNVKDTH